ncbi:MAG: hypothetical protein QM662_15590 [Gordonia sp. (in: high G+C Gram-positive bacteria)]
MNDRQAATVLTRLVAAIDPVLDVLAEPDPFGIKARTFTGTKPGDAVLDRAQYAGSVVANWVEWPGTKAFTELPLTGRARWWATRLGSLNTIGVAAPGVFGAWAKALPIPAYLGFVNQAMMLVAMAREHGVTDRAHQVSLVAAVLCGRDLTVDDVGGAASPTPPAAKGARKLFVTQQIWDAIQIWRAIDTDLAKRPQPPRPLRWLGYLPLIGAPATYVGEQLALAHAITAGTRWLTEHPAAITHPPTTAAEPS